jgi:hypothetical protein
LGFDWAFEGEPDASAGDRRHIWHAGKMLALERVHRDFC